MEAELIAAVIQQWGPVAGLVVVMWKYSGRTIPRLATKIEKSAEKMDKAVDKLLAAADKDRAMYERTLRETTADFKESLRDMREQTARLVSRIPKAGGH